MTSIDQGIVNADGSQFRRAHFRDIDEQASQLLGHDQVYQQISRGEFAGTYTTVGLGGDCWFFIEQLNQTLLQHGSVPRETLSFVVLLTDGSRCRYQGQEFTSDDLAILPPASSFSLLCPAAADSCVITMSIDDLCRYVDLDSKLTTSPHPLKSRELGDAVKIIRRIVQAAPHAVIEGPNRRGQLRKQLVSTLVSCLHREHWTHVNSDRAIVQRACDLIDLNVSDISVAAVCNHIHVSRRTLESVFRREFDMGPSAYIRALRLNHIRRSIVAGVDGGSIADIAARWGMWHPSRFSQTYADLFGELPSTTKSRSGFN